MISNEEVRYEHLPHPSNFASNVEFLKAHREWCLARVDEEGRCPLVDRYIGVDYGISASSDESQATYERTWHPDRAAQPHA